MKSLSGRSLTWVAPLLLLLAPGATRADFYSNWSFSWTFNPVGTNLPGIIPANSTAATGSAQFIAQSGTNGDTTIPVATVQTSSSAGGTVPADSFKNAAFTFGVTITDNTSNASGTLTFDGVLNGQLTGTTSGVVGTFSLDPSSPSSLTLSGHTYQVAVDPSLGLPAPNGLPKLLNASVTVSAPAPPPPNGGGGGGGGGGVTGPPVQSVPEPSAFALAGVAVAALGLAGWWQRQRGRVAPQAA